MSEENLSLRETILVQSDPIVPMPHTALVWVVAIMCFLASLALGATLAIDHAATQWSRGLSGSMTVQIKPSEADDIATRMAKALDVLENTPGVMEAKALSPKDAAALVEPWLGKADILEGLPLPQLIDVRLDPSAGINIEDLRSTLTKAVPGTTLDDHRQWNDRLIQVAGGMRWLSIAVLTLILAAMAIIVVSATRAGLTANRSIVDVLHLVGARDSFVAAQFQRHFFWLALKAGLIGVVVAILAFWVLSYLSGAGSEGFARLLPSLSFDAGFYLFLTMIPLLAIALSVLTARFTVLSVLAQEL